MHIRRPRALLTVAVLLIAGLGTGAVAAQAATTTVTFNVGAGALSISSPASVNLGSGAAGTTISSQLGVVKVDDARGSLLAAWTATVSSTAFTTGGATVPETIGTGSVSYWSGIATNVTGLPVPVPGQLTALLAVDLTIPRTAFSLLTGVGSNSTSWNPTLVIAVPAAAVAGTYTGSVTHSVA